MAIEKNYQATEELKKALTLQNENSMLLECWKEVLEFVEAGADVNTAGERHGRTALFFAVWRDDKDAVKFLLEKGADVNHADKNGAAPIHLAGATNIRKNNISKEVAALLIAANKANVNQADKRGFAPLHFAAQNGHKEAVELLIANKADVSQASNNGDVPLHYAAENGHKEVAELLLKNGADVNQADKRGFAPLHYAAENGHKEVVKLLIANKANVNKASQNGITPLHITSVKGHKEVAELLIANKANVNQTVASSGSTPLFAAVENGHKEIAELLLKNGADVNQAMNNGISPLYAAVLNGRKEIAELLLRNGAKIYVNMVGINGYSPLHYATRNNRQDMVELLLNNRAKADVNWVDTYGYSPLHYATRNNRQGIVDLLLKNGADVNLAEEEDGFAPLDFAARHGHKAVAELLIANGADVNHVSKEGFTPLHSAARHGHKAVAELLIANGADVNHVSKKYITPIHFAAQNGHTEVAELLLENGADLTLKNRKNRTAAEIAKKNGHQGIERLIAYKASEPERAEQAAARKSRKDQKNKERADQAAAKAKEDEERAEQDKKDREDAEAEALQKQVDAIKRDKEAQKKLHASNKGKKAAKEASGETEYYRSSRQELEPLVIFSKKVDKKYYTYVLFLKSYEETHPSLVTEAREKFKKVSNKEIQIDTATSFAKSKIQEDVTEDKYTFIAEFSSGEQNYNKVKEHVTRLKAEYEKKQEAEKEARRIQKGKGKEEEAQSSREAYIPNEDQDLPKRHVVPLVRRDSFEGFEDFIGQPRDERKGSGSSSDESDVGSSSSHSRHQSLLQELIEIQEIAEKEAKNDAYYNLSERCLSSAASIAGNRKISSLKAHETSYHYAHLALSSALQRYTEAMRLDNNESRNYCISKQTAAALRHFLSHQTHKFELSTLCKISDLLNQPQGRNLDAGVFNILQKQGLGEEFMAYKRRQGKTNFADQKSDVILCVENTLGTINLYRSLLLRDEKVKGQCRSVGVDIDSCSNEALCRIAENMKFLCEQVDFKKFSGRDRNLLSTITGKRGEFRHARAAGNGSWVEREGQAKRGELRHAKATGSRAQVEREGQSTLSAEYHIRDPKSLTLNNEQLDQLTRLLGAIKEGKVSSVGKGRSK